MRDSSGIRCFRGRCSVAGVWAHVSGGTEGCCKSTYAFGWFDIILYYATYAFVLGTHVSADANELDRIAEAHLAFWVHAPIPDESLAKFGSLGFDLYPLAFLRPQRAAILTCSSRLA
jgi:hypothetical protein